jgi:hypothetical protein
LNNILWFSSYFITFWCLQNFIKIVVTDPSLIKGP